jgi:hypothetical protein
LILIQQGVETLVTPAPSLDLPDIVTPMTIQGASTRARIFAGYSTERIVEIRASNVSLRNLLIEEVSDCSPGSVGHGAVEIREGGSVVEDVIFRKIRNCNGPGALYASTGFTFVRESVFEDNEAISATGKAGLNIRSDGFMSVVDSQFIETGRCDRYLDNHRDRKFNFSDLMYRSARLNIDGPAELRHLTLAGVDLIVGDGQLSLFNTIVAGDCSFPGTTVTAPVETGIPAIHALSRSRQKIYSSSYRTTGAAKRRPMACTGSVTRSMRATRASARLSI